VIANGSRRSRQRNAPTAAAVARSAIGPGPATAARERLAGEAGALSGPERRQAAIALMIAAAMQAFDATIANVALPQLERGLGGGIDLGAWVMTSYLCASAVSAILTAWLRRRYGARPLFTAATALFVGASLLCAIATSADQLILFRLLQGAAAGVIQPLAQAIILDIYPKQDHGRMLAIWGATIMVGPVLGPLLGGLITDLASWRWIFALNAPLGAIAILGLRPVPSRAERSGKNSIDWVGLVLLVIGVSAVQLTLQRSIGRIWPPAPETAGEAAAAILALTAIALRSRQSRFNLFRFEVFRDLNFVAAAAYNFVVGALLFTTIVFLPALSEGPLGYDATEAGLTIAPRGIATMAAMLAMRYVIDRVDCRILLAIGLVITPGAFALMSELPPHGGAFWLAAASAVQGLGVGLLFTPLATLAFSSVAAELRTDAAGVYNLLRQLGCATGVAIMTAVLQARIESGHDHLLHSIAIAGEVPLPTFDAVVFVAYTSCFRTMAVIAMVTIPGILLFRGSRRGHTR
jgi:DHA2 family multidrug resistance protein